VKGVECVLYLNDDGVGVGEGCNGCKCRFAVRAYYVIFVVVFLYI
jgi:hypothetical protein